MARAKYIQREDNEGFAYKSGEIFRLACCDCGLVHDMVLVSERKGMIGVSARRNNRATGARRRYMKRAKR